MRTGRGAGVGMEGGGGEICNKVIMEMTSLRDILLGVLRYRV